MDEIALMGCLYCAANTTKNIHNAGRLEAFMSVQLPTQRAAFEQLHYKEGARLCLDAVVENRDDIWMSETGGGARLSSEPLQGFSAVDPVIANQLDRHAPLECGVRCLVYGAHSTLASFPFQLVTADEHSRNAHWNQCHAVGKACGRTRLVACSAFRTFSKKPDPTAAAASRFIEQQCEA